MADLNDEMEAMLKRLVGLNRGCNMLCERNLGAGFEPHQHECSRRLHIDAKALLKRVRAERRASKQ